MIPSLTYATEAVCDGDALALVLDEAAVVGVGPFDNDAVTSADTVATAEIVAERVGIKSSVHVGEGVGVSEAVPVIVGDGLGVAVGYTDAMTPEIVTL